MKQVFAIILVGAVIGAAIFLFRGEFESFIARFDSETLPCAEPITYTIGSFDARFGISQGTFLDTIKEAEAVWEKPSGKNLFAYSQNGNLKISLVYDFRQEATEKLRALGIVVGDDKAAYDALRSKYDTMQADYTRKKMRLIRGSRHSIFARRHTKHR